MTLALRLAQRGRKAAFPNPMVGCLLVKDGKIVGQGFHAEFGGPHAEVVALAAAGSQARGSTAYVTLEPCCAHPGKKTPPCAPALVNAGVSRVVAAGHDPNPGVSGGGFKVLRQAGLRAKVGVLAAQAERMNAGFFTRMRRGRPRVVLKTALSLDGRSCAEGGRSRWITGPASRGLTHKLRAGCDAILVGVGTVLADDPSLTSHGAGKDPLRVVLDTRLRLPARARILRGPAKTVIFTASSKKLRGAEVVRVKPVGGRLPLKLILAELARRGVERLLVEGGPTIHASFLREGFVDEAQVFIAPKLLSGTKDPNSAPRLAPLRVQRSGADYLFSGKVIFSQD